MQEILWRLTLQEVKYIKSLWQGITQQLDMDNNNSNLRDSGT